MVSGAESVTDSTIAANLDAPFGALMTSIVFFVCGAWDLGMAIFLSFDVFTGMSIEEEISPSSFIFVECERHGSWE